MTKRAHRRHSKKRNFVFRILTVLMVVLYANAAVADRERGNSSHVVDGQNGRCYAKSVPKYSRDPIDEPRQQGDTEIHKVGGTQDVMLFKYDWFSSELFVICGSGGDVVVVRLGPWHLGNDPSSDHLALAFYNGAFLKKQYSTLDISGDVPSAEGSPSKYANVSVSVSHYSVFSSGPEVIKATDGASSTLKEDWVVRATTVDGRELVFDAETGEIR
jgi:hypothetical protein